jgi:hypothetical protein
MVEQSGKVVTVRLFARISRISMAVIVGGTSYMRSCISVLEAAGLIPFGARTTAIRSVGKTDVAWR